MKHQDRLIFNPFFNRNCEIQINSVEISDQNRSEKFERQKSSKFLKNEGDYQYFNAQRSISLFEGF